MSAYVPPALRLLVAQRAQGICEYCLIHEHDTFLGCQVEHIISQKHGGPTVESNLAYACVFCNRYKGSDLGSTLARTESFTGFSTRGRTAGAITCCLTASRSCP